MGRRLSHLGFSGSPRRLPLLLASTKTPVRQLASNTSFQSSRLEPKHRAARLSRPPAHRGLHLHLGLA